MKYIVSNPNFRNTIIKHLERQEFMKHIGCVLTEIEPGYVVAEMPITKFLEQQIGYVHGGAISTIADVASGFAGFTLVAENQSTVTAELKVSYFRPAVGKHLKAIGTVAKQGNTLHFCEADVYCINEQGVETLVAKATSTMAIIQIPNPLS